MLGGLLLGGSQVPLAHVRPSHRAVTCNIDSISWAGCRCAQLRHCLEHLPAASSYDAHVTCRRHLQRVAAYAGKLPNQADTLFNPTDRSDELITLLEEEVKSTRSVSDLDYLSVSHSWTPATHQTPFLHSTHKSGMHVVHCRNC